jgi:hypothetical protein
MSSAPYRNVARSTKPMRDEFSWHSVDGKLLGRIMSTGSPRKCANPTFSIDRGCRWPLQQLPPIG